MVFDKMSVVLEDLVEKRQQASKAYDEVINWKIYMKDKADMSLLFLTSSLRGIGLS